MAELGAVVDVSLVQRDAARATGEVLVAIQPDGDARYQLVDGRAWQAIAYTPEVAGALPGCAAVVFGTLAQHSPAGLAAWERFVADVPDGCLRVCDPNLRRGHTSEAATRALEAALGACDIVKVNDVELIRIGELFGWPDPLAELRRRCQLVAHTHGADGSTLHGPSGSATTPGFPATPGGDNVGCGDVFAAALTLGAVHGWAPARTGRVGGQLGALVASVRGATPRFDTPTVRAIVEGA